MWYKNERRRKGKNIEKTLKRTHLNFKRKDIVLILYYCYNSHSFRTFARSGFPNIWCQNPGLVIQMYFIYKVQYVSSRKTNYLTSSNIQTSKSWQWSLVTSCRHRDSGSDSKCIYSSRKLKVLGYVFTWCYYKLNLIKSLM